MHKRWDRKELDKSTVYFLSNYMTIYVNMLGAFVEHLIRSYLDCGLVITIKGGWLYKRDTKVLKMVGELLNLACSGR